MQNDQMVERVHALESAQATQVATMAGAEATQAADRAGNMATTTAMTTGTSHEARRPVAYINRVVTQPLNS